MSRGLITFVTTRELTDKSVQPLVTAGQRALKSLLVMPDKTSVHHAGEFFSLSEEHFSYRQSSFK